MRSILKLALSVSLSIVLNLSTDSKADLVSNLENRIKTHPTVLARLKEGNAIVNAYVASVSVRPNFQVSSMRITGPKTEIPLRSDTEEFLGKNCTGQDRTRVQKLGITSQLETTINITKAVDIREEIKTTLSAAGDKDLPVSISRESTKTKTFSLSTSRTERAFSEDKDEWEESRLIPSHTAILVKGTRKVFRERWPFEAVVTATGPVTVYRDLLLQGNFVVRNNPMQFTLEELFPDSTDRSSTAIGNVEAGFAKKTTVSYGQIDLDPKDRKQCVENFFSITPQESAEISSVVQYLSIGINSAPETTAQKTVVTGGQKPILPRLVTARGQHTCSSGATDESRRYQCTVRGSDFADCTHAYGKLKQQNCCINSDKKGRSIAFKIDTCK